MSGQQPVIAVLRYGDGRMSIELDMANTTLRFSPKAEWLELRRTAHRNQVQNRIADFASPEEIEKLKEALATRFKQLATEYSGEDLRYRRRLIRQTIQRIERNELPLSAEEAD